MANDIVTGIARNYPLDMFVLRRFLMILICSGVLLPSVAADEASQIAAAAKQVRGEFMRLDSNQDQRLHPDEFVRREGDAAVLNRDFLLYDFDGSGFLTPSEFAAVSGLTEPSLRGRIPDPFDELVAQAVVALDESYEGWDQRPNELVNAHTFVANFLGSISPGKKHYVTGRILRQADRDSDGRMSRREARKFLQQQLGIRWYDGPMLREPTGRLVRFQRFLDVDRDQNGSLSRSEFESHWWNRDAVEADFGHCDRNANGQITYLEFAHYAAPNFFDPVEWFRRADTDLDATLDVKEIIKATEASRMHLVASTFSGFDSNEDGLLSLQEYRLSMHANVNYAWERIPADANRDGRLSYDEFVFHQFDLFQLQRRYFFHRLDRDADGYLSPSEFVFESRRPDAIHLRSVDGTQSRVVYRDPQYPHCGWPTLSPDARSLLFHRWRPDEPANPRIARIDLFNDVVHDLGDGVGPSWSRDGKRFACARTENRDQIWVINSDGSGGKAVAAGNCPKWSPDGHHIAFLHENGLWLHDVATGENRQLISRDDHAYQNLGDDIAWSPDSRQVALAAWTIEKVDLLIVPIAEQSGRRVGFVTDATERIGGKLAWTSRDGIIFRLHRRDTNQAKLVAVKPEAESEPQPIRWLESGRDWKSACVTPDGKWYTAVSDD